MKEQPFTLNKGDRLLVSRTDRLGDLLIALPLAETLKLRYPECSIDVMASLYASPILDNHECIDRIVRVQNDELASSHQYRRELRQKIRQSGYKVVLVLYPEKRIARLLYKAGVRHRLGTAGRFHSVFFNHYVFHSRKGNKKHEYDYNCDFLQYFKEGKTITEPRVRLTEKEKGSTKRLLAEIGITDHFVVLHPGSAGSAHRWPEERFLELSVLLNKRKIPVLFTGSIEEDAHLTRLSREASVSILSLAGKTDLRTLSAILYHASVVVANSTGPLHLATAVGTKVIGLYPVQRSMSPVRWGPLGEGHIIVQPSRSECPCPSGTCKCMESISAEDVLAKVSISIQELAG